MAILKDLIVHGSSRFLNKIYASEIQTPLIEAEAGIIKKLKADDVTVVGLLDVQGQLHTNSWTNSNIATIDGSFYITPTLSSSSGTVSFSSATAATFTGSYTAVSSLYVGNNTASTVQWTSGSKILITGQVQVNGEWIPLGTLLGTLNSTNPTTSMPIVSITDNRNNTSAILTDIYSLKSNTSLSYRNLKVSLYQRADSSKYYPLGIFMTALGQNGKTFLDIYGGVNELITSYGGYANPNVRIGNLSGLPAITTAAGNFTPVGWGIYTTNGYFSGTIVSNTGVIGGWKLGASSLYNGTTGLNNNTVGIYLGTDGIRNYSTSTQYVNITGGKIKAQGVDLTGKITASSGSIGGWNIGTDTNKSLYYGNQTPGATTTNLILSPTSATNSNAIGGSSTGLTWFISAGKVFGVTTAGALYATSGKIGGWTIGTSSLYNSKSSYNNSNEGLYLGTDYIAGGAGEEWWFKKDGSAKIGTMTLSAAGVLSVPAADISGQLTAATIDASKINSGDISSERITTNVLTALQAKLTSLNTNNLSAITANLGTITAGVIKHDTVGGTNGIWFSADTDTSSNVTIGNSTARKDWRLLVNNKFGVTKAGDLYASSANISGTITATDGTIGGIHIVNGALDVSSINIGNLGGASNYAQKTDIADAKKVATNYLSVDDTGIMIANMKDGEQTPSAATGKNVFIDNDSVDIRDGLNVSASFESDNITFYNADYNEEIATFGTRGARIGKNNEQHFLVDAESLQAINESGSSIFSISSTNATMNSIIKVADGVDCAWQEKTITLEDANYTDETFFIEKILLTIEYPDSDVRPIYDTLAHSTDFLLKSWSKKKLSIEFPQISFTYGTSDSVQYTITFNSRFLNGTHYTYTYTGSLIVSYNGDKTFTFHRYNGSWVCESDPTYSGSHDPTYSSFYNVPYIMAHGTSKAPSMTFGTREVNNEIAPFSTTIGEGLYANSDNQLSIGKYNLNNDPLTNPFMFVIGNGQDGNNRSNALEVDQYGNLNVNGNMRCNSNYLVATKSYYWNNTVGANSAWQVNNYDVTISGYTAVGVVSFGLHNQDSGGRNADWCVVPRCILWGGSTQNLEFYVWNQHTSQSAIVTMMVKVLYVPSNIFGALS